MPRGLPRTAGASLVAAFLLSAFALLFSEGSAYGPLAWIGTLAIIAAGVMVALAFWPLLPLPRPDRFGFAFLGLFTALVVWTGLSIIWSVEPDRSWEYFNRGIVYLAFGVVGLFCARAVERVALGAMVLCGAVVCWALFGKVVPDFFPDGERVARLRDPLGYWNALALVAAVAVLLGVWLASRTGRRREVRVAGAVLVFLSTVALLLTYSRGGVLVAFVIVVVFLVLVPERLQAASALGVGGLPGVAVTLWAFTQDGVAKDLQPYDTRLADGLQFGAVLAVVGALVAGVALVLLRYEATHADRIWRPTRGQWAAAGGVAALCAVVAVLIGSGGDPAGWVRKGFEEFTSPTVGDAATARRYGRLSSNNRWDWWVESWDVFEEHPVAGAGAGAFDVARRPYRRNIIVVVEPHSLPIQFLAETGLVGFFLLLGTFAAGGVACVGGVRRLAGGERTAAMVLAIVALGYLLHALLDYDWDFVGLTGTTLLLVGVLVGAGRPPIRAARRPVAAVGAGLVALALSFSVVAPWASSRQVDEAYEALGEGDVDAALDRAARAQTLNPLALPPLYAEAAAEHARGNRQRALDLYVEAVELQPENWRTWYDLALYEESVGLLEAAIRHATRAQQLDPRHPDIGPFLERLFNAP
jgi:O-antigen ligase